jgi:hypothetical protein
MPAPDDLPLANEAAELRVRLTIRATTAYALSDRVTDPALKNVLQTALDSFHYIEMMFLPRMVSSDATVTRLDRRINQQNAEALYRIADSQVRSVEDALRNATPPPSSDAR